MGIRFWHYCQFNFCHFFFLLLPFLGLKYYCQGMFKAKHIVKAYCFVTHCLVFFYNLDENLIINFLASSISDHFIFYSE